MKKIALLFVFGLLALHPFKSTAQININISTQPVWGPVGYDHVDYYYLPGIESYYSVPQKQFIYLNNDQWVFSRALPAKYNGYDLYNGYKVVVNSPKPYLNFKNDRIKYAKYKGSKGQPAIKYSKDPKYTAVIHANKNGIPPGQAKKIVPGTNQRVVVAGNKGGNGNGHSNGKKK